MTMMTPAFWGNEFTVNTKTPLAQNEPSITALADGRFVVTWTDFQYPDDAARTLIRAQILNADGSKEGNEFIVNSSLTGDHVESKVTALSNGNFVVVWTDATTKEGLTDIHGKVFGVAGNLVRSDFLINVKTTGSQILPDIAEVGSNGGFVVTWQDGDSDGADIKARQFHSDGTATAEFNVNTAITNGQMQPVVTQLNNDRYVIAWSDFSNGSINPDIRAQIYDSNGKVGSELLLKSDALSTNNSFGLTISRLVAQDSSDKFVVAWNEQTSDPDGTTHNLIHAQIYDETGTAVLAHDLVVDAPVETSYQNEPSITALNDGGFMISWTNHFSDQSLSYGWNIYGQVFDASGNKGVPILLDNRVDSPHELSSVTTLADGRVVVTWQDESGRETNDTSTVAETSVEARIIDPRTSGVAVSGSKDANGNDYALNDDFYGTAWADHLTGNGGNDSLHGASGHDVLDGGLGDDVLDGGADADEMRGGAGNDIYIVDNSLDMVIEAANEGTDTVYSSVSWALGANVENLVLKAAAWGIGNDLANAIVGSAGNDVLVGWNDGGVADTLVGGAGDDTYYVDANDKVSDSSGNDTVITDASSVDLAAFPGIENIISISAGPVLLNGSDVANVLTGSSGSDNLYGGGGDDVLNGGGGADRMDGGIGNDIYYVDNAGDVVVERPGQGWDTIFTSVSFNIGGNEIENLFAMPGSGNLSLTGNAGANTIRGNAGNDTIYGGSGNDALTGGSGNDVFVFDTKLGTYKTNRTMNFDTITDFTVKQDKIYLDNAVFKKLGKGSLSKPGKLNKDFFAFDKAKDGNDYLIYNKKTGVLSYDADGSGHGKAIDFAQLSKNLKTLSYKDFLIV